VDQIEAAKGLSHLIEAGKQLNLLVCALVVAGGFYWLYVLDRRWQHKYRFLYRAYTCWWLAWLVWLIIYTLMMFQVPRDPTTRDVVVLTISDLNGLFFILVYFNLTRGNAFRVKDALFRSITILFVLGIGYGSLYVYFKNDFSRAYEIHESIGLCVGFVTTMLLGWAFALRFNTQVVIVVGYCYGFSQPFAYKVAFHAQAASQATGKEGQLFVVVLLVLAFLKIVLATVVTTYLVQKPEYTGNLVVESRSRSNIGSLHGWVGPVGIQTLLLLTVFMYFLSRRLPNLVGEVMKTIGQLVGFFAVLMGGIKLWGQIAEKLNRPDAAQTAEQREDSRLSD
jgi:hypothetical protein